MKYLIKAFSMLLVLISLSNADIINVPADIDSIQGGIDLANQGDTVLVQPGTYYENINFNGKNIVVASLTLTTNDTSYISQTVINGNGNWSNNSLVTFENGGDSLAHLCGFTITGAVTFNQRGAISIEDASPKLSYLLIKNNLIETVWEVGGFGGGIYCKNSNSIITDVAIKENISMAGGGIYCDSSNITLMNVIVINNEATTGHTDGNAGGGIYFHNSSPTLVNVKVLGNDGGYGGGGGIYCNNSSPILSNVTINNNFSGGIFFYGNSQPIFNPINRCNIYNNHTNGNGNDLSSPDSKISIIVDTFSVLNPTDYYAYPVVNFTFNILNSLVEPVNSNLYVNPNGNNENSGISSTEPLRSVSYALSKILADSINPRSIHIANGIYSNSTTGEEYPLRMREYVSLNGESKTGVILDAENLSNVMEFYNDKGVTVENVTITGGLANTGAGISSFFSNPYFSNVIITGNRAINDRNGSTGQAGGIFFYRDNPTLSNVIISNNAAPSKSAVWCRYSKMVCSNVTITCNTTLHSCGVYCDQNSSAVFVNSIIWDNLPLEILFDSDSEVHAFYSDIKDGWSGTGNIDIDPMFADTATGDYRLQIGSPCINKGIQDTMIIYNDGQDTLFISPMDYIGSAPDMGAYEFDPATKLKDKPKAPLKFSLSQNYPNPFNPITNIEYRIQNFANVNLSIYNLLGQKVATLVNKKQPAGSYQVQWDASGFASGIYIYQLKARDQKQGAVLAKKLLLLK